MSDSASRPVPSREGSAAPEEDVVEFEVEVPEGHVVVVGPDGEPLGTVPASVVAQHQDDPGTDGAEGSPISELVEQPAKVMRIGAMVRHLLDEVKAAPLDEESRTRLRDIHRASVKELESGLAPELVEELERLALPFSDDTTPTEAELRIAQAQLVGWLEGLFHGIQTAVYAQQLASRAQTEQIRGQLPGSAQPGEASDGQPGGPHDPHHGGGMYL